MDGAALLQLGIGGSVVLGSALTIGMFGFALLKNRFQNRAVNYPHEEAIERLKQGFVLPAIAYFAAVFLGLAAHAATSSQWNTALLLVSLGFILIEIGGVAHALRWRTNRRPWMNGDASTLAANLAALKQAGRRLTHDEQEQVLEGLRKEEQRDKKTPDRGPESLRSALEDAPALQIPNVWSYDFLMGEGLMATLSTRQVFGSTRFRHRALLAMLVAPTVTLLLVCLIARPPHTAWLLLLAFSFLAFVTWYMAARGHLIGDIRAKVLLSLDIDEAKGLLSAVGPHAAPQPALAPGCLLAGRQLPPRAPVSRRMRLRQLIMGT